MVWVIENKTEMIIIICKRSMTVGVNLDDKNVSVIDF